MVVDAANMEDQNEILKLLKTRSGIQKPHGLLLDVTGTHVSPTSLQAAKTHAKSLMPIIKATAVVGPESVIGFMAKAVTRLTGMNIRIFATRQEAMDWLASEVNKQ